MIRVGHPSYTGDNAPKWHANYGAALADMLSRGVDMRGAHRALQDAMRGVLGTASKRIGPAGRTLTFCCEVRVFND